MHQVPAIVAWIMVCDRIVQRDLVLHISLPYPISEINRQWHGFVGDITLVPQRPINCRISETASAGEQDVLCSGILKSIDIMHGMLGHDIPLPGPDHG